MKKLILILAFLLITTSGWCVDYTQDANCQGAWLFTEGTSTTVDDASANSNVGTIVGSISWSTTVPGIFAAGSVDIASAWNSYIDIGANASLTINRNLTLVAWIYPHSVTGSHGIISHGNKEWYLRLNGTKLSFLDSGEAELLLGGTVLEVNHWYHVAVTVDNATPANIIIYLNGASEGTGTTTATLNDGSVNAAIGADGAADSEHFDGLIAESAVFNRVLSSTEINAIKNSGLKPTAVTGYGQVIIIGE